MRAGDELLFEARSPVGRYWLINGAGFTVCRADGAKLGVVEEVVVDHVRARAEHVIVRPRGLFRRRKTIAAGAVEAVVPASQLLVVAPAPRRTKRRSLTGRALRRLAAGIATDVVAARAVTRREVPKLGRRLGRWARTASVRLSEAARVAGRVLGELTVLAAVLATAAWRRAAAALATPRALPPESLDEPQWPSDADAPLAREERGESAAAPPRAGRRR